MPGADVEELSIVQLDPVRDGEEVIEFYRSLSRQSIKSRFMCMMSDVEGCVRSLLASRPIIYGVRRGGELIAVGEAYGKGGVYEIALAVKDKHQGRGIGKMLVGFMLSDLFNNRGATRVYAYMSIDNIRMVRISRYYGGRIMTDGDTYKVVFDPVNLKLRRN
ncbi:MAG: GNAT family N-acetyltransferase [Caldivirga sp.]